jgi:3-oxoacyl-[acyl-carrier protein] reductase
VRLYDKIAIVTGASRGIGRAIAERLVAEGAKVAINYRASAEQAEEVVAAIQAQGGEAIALQADVSDFQQAHELMQVVIKQFGRVDILVNNAGTTRDTLLMMMKEADWDLVIDTNLKSVFNCCKAVARSMVRQRSGRIINITSVAGLAGNPGQTNYAASKAGIVGFTKSLAKELGSRSITVNAIAPGFVPTALTDSLPEDLKQAAIEHTPLGRFGKPEEIAAAVAFFASDEAGFITGQVLSVDCGLAMQ